MNKNKIIKISKKCLLGFLAINLILIIISLFINVDKIAMNEDNIFPPSLSLLDFDTTRNYQKIRIASLLEESELEDNSEYKEKVYRWENEKEINFNIEINENKEYEIAIDYTSLQDNVQEITLDVVIDGKIISDYQNVILPTYWTDSTSTKVYDIYQNEVTQMQINNKVWVKYFLYDQRYYGQTPLSFTLSEGNHEITLKKTNGSLLLGNIYVFEKANYQTYNSELNTKESNSSDELIVLEGENPTFKSSPEIRATSVQYSHLTPYSTSKNMLNNLSGESFNTSGDSVTYCFKVNENGYYNIDVKYFILQTNTTVYSKILLDNVILYDKFNRYPFYNTSSNFIKETLNENGEAIAIYLTKGEHSLTFRLDASLQSPIYYELVNIIDEINELYLEVVKLTGGNTDKNKTWNIEKFIPTAKSRLDDWVKRLDALKTLIKEVSRTNPNKQNRLYQQIDNAYRKIVSLAKEPNKLPHKLNVLAKGSSSAALMLSNSLHASTFSPLSIDKIYIYGSNVKIPKIKNSFIINYLATAQRIVRTNVTESDKNTVNIWVNRSTYYVSVMQQFADAYYSPTSGIKIRFSLLPDESKLIYANASDTQPDAAFGVSSLVPYTLGIRGALVDLDEMSDFGKTISKLSAGSLMNMIEDSHVYGLPETQDFQVTFYREDILNSLGVEVPETYEDIIEILPTLQRYGMNYYMPMAGGSGLKNINITSPFIYQYGGDLYTNDYLETDITSQESIEAINMMVDLFALYSLPLTTQNFYDSFRNGLTPVGISGFDTYMQFLNAAPEIAGKWHLALAPGVNRDGEINRMQTGDTRAVIIFAKSNMKEEAWDFIKWWLSTDIQNRFASSIEATYGPTFLWNTANLEAFKNLALPEEDKEIILKQWEYLYSVPQTPATYMVERGISNIWNSAVFNGASVRASVTDYALEINREITRKMIEFKYIDANKKLLKTYKVPSIEEIIAWQKE